MNTPTSSLSPKTAAELLDMYYLPMRSALVETAAALDRIERGRGYAEIAGAPPLACLREVLKILSDGQPGGGDRAERVLNLLSVE